MGHRVPLLLPQELYPGAQRSTTTGLPRVLRPRPTKTPPYSSLLKALSAPLRLPTPEEETPSERPRVECLFPQLEPAPTAGFRIAPGPEPERSHSGQERLSRVASGTRPAASGVARSGPRSALSAQPEAAGSQVSASQAPMRNSAARMLVKFPVSVASTENSGWMQHYWKEPGITLKRGLLSKDIHFVNETSPGVCVMKQVDYPLKEGRKMQENAFRIAKLDAEIERLEALEAEIAAEVQL